jgi:hypothetical protein
MTQENIQDSHELDEGDPGFQHLVAFSLQTEALLHDLSPRANYTDRATTACRRNDCQLLRIEGATWSA